LRREKDARATCATADAIPPFGNTWFGERRAFNGTKPMAAKKNENLRLAGILVLVFDTDEDARDTLKANLEFCGAIVSVAASSREVLAILAQFRPHVIVTDLTMPDEDCYELLNEVRNLAPENRKIAAIALSVSSNGDGRRRAADAGFQVFVQKPFELGDLCDAIIIGAGARGKATS